MGKKLGKILAAGALAVAADYIALRAMFSMAFDSRSSLSRESSIEDSPYCVEYKKGIAWVNQSEKKNVTVESFDGLKLRGFFIKAEKPERTLIMCHGWRGTWEHDFAACAQELAGEGCNLLIISQRGQGDSEGKYMSMGILERRDCISWANWVSKQEFKDLPVYLYGVSMGAASVLMASGGELPGCVKGVIADCGFSSAYDILLRTGKKKIKGIGRHTMRRFGWLSRKRAGIDINGYSVKDAMAECRVPVLFIHGRADDFVPYTMTLENYKACRAPKRILLVDGAAHCMSYLVDKEKYMGAVREFFQMAEED